MSRIIKPSKPHLRIVLDVDSGGQVIFNTYQANPFGGYYDKPTTALHPITYANIFSALAAAAVQMTMQAVAQGNKPTLDKPEGTNEAEDGSTTKPH